MDCFKNILVDIDERKEVLGEEIFTQEKDVYIQWNADVEKYRQHSISQYNNNELRATDEFCVRNFLNIYTISINVFGLHSNLHHKKLFNQLINEAWHNYEGKEIPEPIIYDENNDEDIIEDDDDYYNF